MIKLRVPIALLVALLIALATYFLIQIAKGYKFDFGKKAFQPTGLLVATSIPDGAQIWINGRLESATNTTISLPPNTYKVEIKKDGFSLWSKALKIEKELVTKTDAYLFPLVPDLKALTFTGAANPVLSPDGTRLIFAVYQENLKKNGLWVLELGDLPLGISREPRQILQSFSGQDFTKGTFRWSTDSKQVLVSLGEETYLLDPASFTLGSSLKDITKTLTVILAQWNEEAKIRQDQKLKRLPPPLLEILQGKTKEIVFSPDETKILYTATASGEIPENLIPPLPATSTQREERSIKPNRTYVYDIKEDRNFGVADEETNISWFPTSKHLIQVKKEKITIMEYDGTNRTVVYSGPYEFPFVFPFPSTNKILILTALGKGQPLNLYAVSLR